MPMRCPRCSTPPPFDPFLCTTCGEHLLTYLDEPLGPGTGIRADGTGDGVGVRTGAMTEPRTGGFAAAPGAAGRAGSPAQGDAPGFPPLPPAPPRQSDNTGP